MATGTKHQRLPRGKVAAKDQLALLRAEVARLRAEIRSLKTRQPRTHKGGKTFEKNKEAAATVPALPAPNADGNYPATETLRVILAQQLIRRREAAGWTQAELAARARVRQETVSRLETGKHAPNVATVDKLDRALKEAGV